VAFLKFTSFGFALMTSINVWGSKYKCVSKKQSVPQSWHVQKGVNLSQDEITCIEEEACFELNKWQKITMHK
jgi:hypothetical protein